MYNDRYNSNRPQSNFAANVLAVGAVMTICVGGIGIASISGSDWLNRESNRENNAIAAQKADLAATAEADRLTATRIALQQQPLAVTATAQARVERAAQAAEDEANRVQAVERLRQQQAIERQEREAFAELVISITLRAGLGVGSLFLLGLLVAHCITLVRRYANNTSQQLQAKKTELHQIELQLQTSSAQLAALQSAVNATSARSNDAGRKLGRVLRQISLLTPHLESAQRELADSTKQVQSQHQLSTTLSEEIATKQAEVEQLSTLLEGYRQEAMTTWLTILPLRTYGKASNGKSNPQNIKGG